MSKELYGKTMEEWEEYYTQNPNSLIVADKYIIVLKSKLKEAEEENRILMGRLNDADGYIESIESR